LLDYRPKLVFFAVLVPELSGQRIIKIGPRLPVITEGRCGCFNDSQCTIMCRPTHYIAGWMMAGRPNFIAAAVGL